jgi:hypothetical protein
LDVYGNRGLRGGKREKFLYRFFPFFYFLYDYYAQIYFIPYLFYFYFYYFIFSLVILRFTLLFILCLFDLLPSPLLLHSIQFFPIILTLPQGQHLAILRPVLAQVSEKPLIVSLLHLLPRAVLILYSSNLSFIFLIFTVGFLGFIYLALSLYFPPSLLLYSIYVFPTVLAVCILGTPSSYTLSVSTPLSPYWLSSHHTFCYPAVLSRIYVIGFLFHSDS